MSHLMNRNSILIARYSVFVRHYVREQKLLGPGLYIMCYYLSGGRRGIKVNLSHGANNFDQHSTVTIIR